MLAMFGLVPEIDEYIINVDDDEMMKDFLEHLIHKSLED